MRRLKLEQWFLTLATFWIHRVQPSISGLQLNQNFWEWHPSSNFFFKELFFKKKYPQGFYLFIFGCVGPSLLRAGFSLVAVSGGYSSLWCAGFSLRWLLLLRSTGSRRTGFSSCGSRALERRLSSCGTRA